ncbi:MAG: hypothetical protein CMH53_02845, partial [Myxococcales bacterium]|nr:hypothetical protein [Myxococcales bacterium]
DVHYELWLLLNRANGQYHRLITTLTPLLYGGAMWPCDFRVANTGRASVWVGDTDPRHSKLKGPLIGSKAHCKTEHGYRVCRGFQRALSQAWDPILDEAIMSGPCYRPSLR